ncbi:MAG: phosphate starvation protein PhoH [Gammaproteobacteria bacterium]|nr:phosphate starvation protein PhoH [Gammaproteobacteria bacterium]
MSAATNRRMFVLDTNVLMHDPTALFRFQEHDIFIPMVVLEELDAGKKGQSEVARNARQASRFIDDLIDDKDSRSIENGLALNDIKFAEVDFKPQGRLYLQTQILSNRLPAGLPGKNADNTILETTLSLQSNKTDTIITLVSKDINLRIKARVLGIHTEDYYNDKVLDDANLLYSGVHALPKDFWEKNSDSLESWQKDLHTYYRIKGKPIEVCYPNQCLYKDDDEAFEALVRHSDEHSTTLVVATNHRRESNNVWGITARNREQSFALNLLMDPDVDLVTLLGAAGTGKTLLALAAGLQQTIEDKRYREIILTRVTIPLGEDIGFLPGTEEEKMAPWMGALLDNLEVLTSTETNSDWAREATADLVNKRIKIRSLNFMRGRTFINRYVIIDEAQNLTSKQMKTLITRAGPGSKVVCLGNIAQIDTPYLTETTSGLTFVVDRFKGWQHSGHVTLKRGERSRLADFASDIL